MSTQIVVQSNVSPCCQILLDSAVFCLLQCFDLIVYA